MEGELIPNDYKAQLKRAKWFLDKVKKHSKSTDDNIDNEAFFNYLYAGFLFNYHVKDVLKQKVKGVESYINSIPELKMCADVANSVKHIKLKRKRSNLKDSHQRLANEKLVHVETANSEEGLEKDLIAGTEIDLLLEHNKGNEHSAIKVLERAIQKWEDFIKEIQSLGAEGVKS